jgi:integrase
VHYFALTKDLRLKNDASVRSMPVHQELIELGFLAFVDGCEGLLFPNLVQHTSGRWSEAWGKHFARFLKALGIKADGKDFHSFRHTFIAAAEASGLEFSARKWLVGHALQGQTGRYGLS